MKEKRNTYIDSLRIILCYLIIVLHMGFANNTILVDIIVKCGVPCFLVITGFYYEHISNDIKKFRVRIRRNCVILLSAAIFYMAFKVITAYISGGITGVKLYFSSMLTWKALLEFLLYGRLQFAEHLWYLMTLAESLILMYLLQKVLKKQYLYILMFLLLVGNLLLGKYSVFVLGIDFDTLITRNTIFTGLPFILLGDWVRENQNRLRCQYIFLIIMSVCILLIEYFLFKRGIVQGYGNIYISNILGCVMLLVTVIRLNDCNANIPWNILLSNLGHKHSLYIYIFHVAIISSFKFVIEKTTVNTDTVLYKVIASIMVLCFSIIVSMVLVWIKGFYKRCDNKGSE